MIVLGLILLIIGFVAKIAILWTIGIIVLVVGLILALLGATGRAVGGRRHYWEPPGAGSRPACGAGADPAVRCRRVRPCRLAPRP
jgi:Family of unknown function (DUF6131)